MSGEETKVSDIVAGDVDSKEFLTESDRHTLDLVKMKMALALANAEKALAQNETAKISYDNLVLQLTFKYSLREKDVITEQGEILRGKGE